MRYFVRLVLLLTPLACAHGLKSEFLEGSLQLRDLMSGEMLISMRDGRLRHLLPTASLLQSPDGEDLLLDFGEHCFSVMEQDYVNPHRCKNHILREIPSVLPLTMMEPPAGRTVSLYTSRIEYRDAPDRFGSLGLVCSVRHPNIVGDLLVGGFGAPCPPWVFAISYSTGQILWNRQLPRYSRSPNYTTLFTSVLGPRVLVSSQAVISAFDLYTGDALWTLRVPEDEAHTSQLLRTESPNVFLIDMETSIAAATTDGTILWADDRGPLGYPVFSFGGRVLYWSSTSLPVSHHLEPWRRNLGPISVISIGAGPLLGYCGDNAVRAQLTDIDVVPNPLVPPLFPKKRVPTTSVSARFSNPDEQLGGRAEVDVSDATQDKPLHFVLPDGWKVHFVCAHTNSEFHPAIVPTVDHHGALAPDGARRIGWPGIVADSQPPDHRTYRSVSGGSRSVRGTLEFVQ